MAQSKLNGFVGKVRGTHADWQFSTLCKVWKLRKLRNQEMAGITTRACWWDYRHGHGDQRPSDCMGMLDGCASSNVVEFDKAARDEFFKMAGEGRGGYLSS